MKENRTFPQQDYMFYTITVDFSEVKTTFTECKEKCFIVGNFHVAPFCCECIFFSGQIYAGLKVISINFFLEFFFQEMSQQTEKFFYFCIVPNFVSCLNYR